MIGMRMFSWFGCSLLLRRWKEPRSFDVLLRMANQKFRQMNELLHEAARWLYDSWKPKASKRQTYLTGRESTMSTVTKRMAYTSTCFNHFSTVHLYSISSIYINLYAVCSIHGTAFISPWSPHRCSNFLKTPFRSV
jgi:hypothetical protein